MQHWAAERDRCTQGHPHTPIVVSEGDHLCGWRNLQYVNDWEPRRYYSCRHAELCAVCGKILRISRGWLHDSPLAATECPDYREPGS